VSGIMTEVISEIGTPLVPEYRNDDFRRGFIEFLPERIYFQSGTYMYCLDSNGALIFKYEIDAPSRSSPSIRGNKCIYFGDGAGNLYILKPNGELVRKFYLSASLETTPYINEEDDKIYVTTDTFWECDMEATGCTGLVIDYQGYSSPTAEGRIAYAGFDDGYLYEVDFETLSYIAITVSGAEAVRCSPVKEDRRVYWNSRDGTAFYYDFERREGYASYHGLTTDSTMAKHGNYLYLASYKKFACFEWTIFLGRMTFLKRWEREDIKSAWSSPALFISDDELLYIFIGATDFNLYALKDKGEDVYAFKTGDVVESSPLVDSSANAYFGSNDGYFYAVDISGNLIFKYQTEDAIKASPSLQKSDRIIVEGIEYIVREGVRLPLVKKGDIIKSEHHNNQVIFTRDVILKYLPPSYTHVKL